MSQLFEVKSSCMIKACSLSYGGGCLNLGNLYDNGEGVKKDVFKAVELYEKACSLNDATGFYNLGVLYHNGEGVRKNLKKAKELYGKSCDLKYEEGCRAYAKLP